MMIKPCGTQVLIKLEEVKEMSEGGIVMQTPEQKKKEEHGQNMGRLLAIGPLVHADWDGFESENSEGKAKQWGYELGDLVLFRRYDGVEYELPGLKNHRLLPSNCILGKVEE